MRCAALAALALFAGKTYAADAVYMTREQAVAWSLPGAQAVVTNPVEATSRTILLTGLVDGHVTGHAALIDEIGKHMPITFVVALAPDGSIRDMDVAVYRERIGGAVRNRSFLDQFKGKRRGDGLKIGKDIDGISGATLSAMAAERAARRALDLSKKLP